MLYYSYLSSRKFSEVSESFKNNSNAHVATIQIETATSYELLQI